MMSDTLVSVVYSALLGAVTAIGLMWFGEWSAPGSIFIGITVAIILGTFLNLVLFKPLPKIENGKLVDDQ
nr:hypothetical protein [uncultured bacterium]